MKKFHVFSPMFGLLLALFSALFVSAHAAAPDKATKFTEPKTLVIQPAPMNPVIFQADASKVEIKPESKKANTGATMLGTITVDKSPGLVAQKDVYTKNDVYTLVTTDNKFATRDLTSAANKPVTFKPTKRLETSIDLAMAIGGGNSRDIVANSVDTKLIRSTA